MTRRTQPPPCPPALKREGGRGRGTVGHGRGWENQLTEVDGRKASSSGPAQEVHAATRAGRPAMCRERRVLCFPTVLVHEEVLPPPAAPAALSPCLHRAWSRHSRWLHDPGPGTNALTPGGVSNRNLFSLSSGGRSCKIKAWGAWFPLRLRRAPVPGLPPRLLVVCCASLGFLRVTPGFPAHGVLSVRPAVVMERGSPFAVMWDEGPPSCSATSS